MPDAAYSKSSSLAQLLREGENVAISHQLFARMEIGDGLKETIDELGYVLILDEEIEVIEPIQVSNADKDMLFSTNRIAVREDGYVQWLDDSYSGKFGAVKAMAKSNTLLYYHNSFFMWLIRPDILAAFDDITVMTFLFGGSFMKYYFDLHKVEYEICYVEDCVLYQGKQDLTKEKETIKSLLHIYEGKLNTIGDKTTALSSTWYSSNRGKIKALTNNALNYLQNICHSASGDALWTTFSEVQKRYPVTNYVKAFASCNLRATNAYATRHNLAYLINVYQNPFIVGWFYDQGISLDSDAIALSQLLQWIWRSAIRNGEEVNLYLPSKRMRDLLNAWLCN